MSSNPTGKLVLCDAAIGQRKHLGYDLDISGRQIVSVDPEKRHHREETDKTMFKVLQIDHVELFVPDRYEAARWFERVLGLRIVPECEAWAAGGGPLMISSDEGSTKLALFEGTPDASTQAAAFRRVAFRVTADGFAEFLRRLPELALLDSRNRPVVRDSVVDHQQAYSIYFNDPWTHQLEVTTYEYDAVSAQLRSPSSS